MEKFAFAQGWREINALVPVYDELGGNSTLVCLTGGQKFLDRRKMRSVLRSLAQVFATDLRAARSNYAHLINRKNSVPLALHQNLILVPVKMRQPAAKDQGAWGYVVKSKVLAYRTLEDNPHHTEIIFEDQTSIRCIQGKDSIRSILNDAEIVEQAYRRLYLVSVVRGEDGSFRVKEVIDPFAYCPGQCYLQLGARLPSPDKETGMTPIFPRTAAP